MCTSMSLTGVPGVSCLPPVLSPESLLQARGLCRYLLVWGAEGVQREGRDSALGGAGTTPREREAFLTATALCCLCQCE